MIDFENFDSEKIFEMRSKRHHYIPQFLSYGFTDTDNHFYLYDKKEDIIRKDRRSPKSVFFELDRNTIYFPDGRKSSFMETIMYGYVEDSTKKAIMYLQKEEIENIIFTPSINAELEHFLISLFWRIPYTDNIVKDLLNRSSVEWGNLDPEMLKSEMFFQKPFRYGLISKTLDELLRTTGGEYINELNIHQIESEDDYFVLSDNPILYRKVPNKFLDIWSNDCLFAVTSKRLISKSNPLISNLSDFDVMVYNICMIKQATRYIVCKDLDTLKFTVDSFKLDKMSGSTKEFTEEAFKVFH